MELAELRRHVRILACVPQTDAPVLSCYVNLDGGRSVYLPRLRERIAILRGTLSEAETQPFEAAWHKIEEYVANKVPLGARSVALFARGGTISFFFPMVFRVPLPTSVSIDSTPNIYHLVELKDTYEHYVILIWTGSGAQILEVNVGAVTRELWIDQPELRERVGQEWARRRYQSHHRRETTRLIREAVAVVSELMASSGHVHLILAGRPEMIWRVRRELPEELAAKVIDDVPTKTSAALPEVVARTLYSFIRFEEQQSVSFAKRLLREVRTGGPAVVGTRDTLKALRTGQADVLIMAQSYQPDLGWACPQCGLVSGESPPGKCPDCGSTNIKGLDVKEEMVRLAERRGCVVEIVRHAMRFGGVGALVRFQEGHPDGKRTEKVTAIDEHNDGGHSQTEAAAS